MLDMDTDFFESDSLIPGSIHINSVTLDNFLIISMLIFFSLKMEIVKNEMT